MPWAGKQRAEPAGLGQEPQRWDQNGERRGCRLRRRRKRGENCGDLGAWLAQNLLVAGENCSGRARRPAWQYCNAVRNELVSPFLPNRGAGTNLNVAYT